MKKRFPWVWAILIIIAILVLLAYWFWSLGNISPVQVGGWKLEARGSVLVLRDGSEEPATSGMDLKQGDVIKTGNDGEAIVTAAGRAQINIDKNSTYQIEEFNPGSIMDFGLRAKLQSGRIWSRLLKLMDLDSTFVNRTDQVVSTVRGTSYSFETDGNVTKLWMEHGGTVDKSKTGKNLIVSAGQWAAFDNSRTEAGEAASSTWVEQSWLDINRPQDVKFSMDASALLTKALIAGGKSAPDAWSYGISQSSESLHLSFAGSKAPDLYGQYAARRLGYIKDLIDRGKSGLAFYHLNDFENTLNQKLEDPKAKDYRPGLQKALATLVLSLSDTQPGTLMFRLKLKAEDLYAKVWENDPAMYLYAKLISVDSRLDEVEALLCKPESKQAYEEAFNAVDQGLKRSQEDWSKLPAKDGNATAVKEKMDMQTARFEHAKKLAALCINPPSNNSQTSTSTQSTLTPTSTSQTTTSTTPKTSDTNPTGSQTPPTTQNPPATTNPPTTQITDLGLSRIELYAQPNPANVGDTAKLYVKGYKADGSTMDATSYAKFSQVGGLGTFSGANFMCQTAGSATLVAQVPSGSQTLTARTSLQINAGAVSVSRIEVTVASGGLNVYLGQTRTLKATAYYSNGFSADVTSKVSWSLSNTLGSISGTTFTANSKQTGSVAATATYTEGGITKEGQITFQILQTAATGAVN